MGWGGVGHFGGIWVGWDALGTAALSQWGGGLVGLQRFEAHAGRGGWGNKVQDLLRFTLV